VLDSSPVKRAVLTIDRRSAAAAMKIASPSQKGARRQKGRALALSSVEDGAVMRANLY
jgi:hypothetical protein